MRDDHAVIGSGLVSSGRYVILVRYRETDEIKAVPDMTLYDLDGAKAVLETVRKGYDWQNNTDYDIEIYQRYWEPVKE